MCDSCNKWYSHLGNGKRMPLRPDDVSAVEWARYAKAKRLHDERKLAAMLPAWIKYHMNQSKIPDNPKPWAGQPPYFPAWLRTCNPAGLHFHHSS